MLGMLTARRLLQEGLSVALLEQGKLCREASWAGGGILSPLAPWDYPEAVTALVSWSQQYYPLLAAELLEQTGIDPEWTQSGLLLTACEPDAIVQDWHRRHPCALEILDEAQLQEIEPGVALGQGPAIHLPDVAQARNPRLGKALGIALQMQGMALYEDTRVTGLQLSQGKIQGVSTDQGDFAADYVVVAGGAWSAEILKGYTRELPVSPVLGQMIMFEAEPGLVRHIVLHDGHYLIPRRDGLLLAGSTLEYTGFNKETSNEARELLAAMALELFPVLSDYPIVRHWAGLRPGTADGVPFIGEHNEISGLFLNTGHFRNGVVMAPGSAQLLVDGMVGRPGFTDPQPYLPGRIA